MLGWIFFAGVTLVPVAAGYGWRQLRARRPELFDRMPTHLVPFAVILVASVVGALLIYKGHDPEVAGSEALGGALLALVGLGLPILGYYSLGYFVKRGWVVGVAWLISLAPLAMYGFVVGLMVISKTQCPPDAYECPL
jgi:hypothetical protein